MVDLPPSREPAPIDVVVARPIPSATAPALVARPVRPLELPELSRRAAGAGVLAAGLLLVCMVGISVVLGGATGVSELHDDSDASAAAFNRFVLLDKVVNAVVALGVLLLLLRVQGLSLLSFGLHGRRFGAQLAWAMAALGGVWGAVLFSSVLVLAIVEVFPGAAKDLVDRVELLRVLSTTDLFSAALLLVAVSVHEEVVFRGLLIPYLRRLGCGWVGAVLLSTTVFAVLHISQGWLAILQVFCVGAALGLFFVWSRSLTAVMIAHFLYNFGQFQLARVLLPWVQRISPEL